MLALWAVGFLAIVRFVEDYVIYPRLIRRGVELHPLAVILAILAGAELNGVAGMFLAVPTVAIASSCIGIGWGGTAATTCLARPPESRPVPVWWRAPIRCNSRPPVSNSPVRHRRIDRRSVACPEENRQQLARLLACSRVAPFSMVSRRTPSFARWCQSDARTEPLSVTHVGETHMDTQR
jgi:AI-2E family transporter